jgi:hypothetical protein
MSAHRLAELGIHLRWVDQLGRKLGTPPAGRAANAPRWSSRTGGSTWLCHRCASTGGFAPEPPNGTTVRWAPKPREAHLEHSRYNTLAPWVSTAGRRGAQFCRPRPHQPPARLQPGSTTSLEAPSRSSTYELASAITCRSPGARCSCRFPTYGLYGSVARLTGPVQAGLGRSPRYGRVHEH